MRTDEHGNRGWTRIAVDENLATTDYRLFRWLPADGCFQTTDQHGRTRILIEGANHQPLTSNFLPLASCCQPSWRLTTTDYRLTTDDCTTG